MDKKIIQRFILGICIWGILMFPIGIVNAVFSPNKASGLAILFSYLAMMLSMSIAFKVKSPTSQTKSSNEDFPKGEHNMGLEVQKSKISSPKLSPTEITSPNPNIIGNFKNPLVSREQLNYRRLN